MRAFIAVEFDAAIRERLAEVATRLRAASSGVKWVSPEQMHLTLKFLGEIEESAVDEVAVVMAEAASGIAPFEVRVAGVGAFPPHGAPRVVWAGLDDAANHLKRLHVRLDSGVAELGVERESRPFAAHLTLGRVKDPRASQGVRAAIEREAAADLGVQKVEELVLFQSVLSPKGPMYTGLRRQRLSAP